MTGWLLDQYPMIMELNVVYILMLSFLSFQFSKRYKIKIKVLGQLRKKYQKKTTVPSQNKYLPLPNISISTNGEVV